MSYRRTLVFLVVFAALAAFYYFYEIKGGETRRRVEEEKTLLFSFEPKEATKLTLNKAGDTIIIERQDAGWAITAPVSAPVEKGAVDRMLETLAKLKYERDIGAQDDLEPFGLAEPETQVEAANEDRVLARILLGAFTPDGKKLYAKLAHKESVFTLNSSVKDKLDKDVFDLRDKKVIDFSIPDVTGLTVARDGRTFVFEKSSDADWQMTSPADYKADAGRIRKLLDAIRFARVKKFVEEEADDLEKFGLESPSALVKLEFADKATALSFGSRTGPDNSSNFYVRRNDDRQVLELGADILDNLSDDIDDWRDRTLLDFERAGVAKLQILAASTEIMLEHSPEGPEQWMLSKPEPGAADNDKVQSLLSYLHSTKIIRFVKGEELETAERALETPEAQLKLWEKESETPKTLSVSRSEDQSEIYARTEPDGEVSAVRRGLLDELLGGPDRLKDRSVLKFEMSAIEKIKIAKGEQKFAINRKGVKWRVPRGLDIEDYEVDRLLWDLRELEYTAVSPREKDDEAYGFDSPAMTIELWPAGTDTALRLVVGSRIAERNSYYALGGDETLVLEIEGALISEWLEKF